ncbi:winged helix-turn-helix transcriptional regulator [Burkholderia sp. Ac-20344]|nr:MarR family winged helix-turn-helix transcriptional regulator [Burkholderia sp. Ac-20344]MBN3836072.1 winged helix-turn-helix transcriptional regulator [Burkholderia sp. Ac-20344]
MKKPGRTSTSVDLDSPDVCYALAGRRSARFVTRIYESYLEPAGITSSEFSILSLLEFTPAITVAELARKMEMERTTLVRALKPMREAGYVCEGEEKLGRAVTLVVSKAGLKKLAQAKPYWEAAQKAFEKRVGKAEAALFREMALAAVSHRE